MHIKKAAWVVALAVGLLAEAASAQCPATPNWASSRNPGNCDLTVNAGPGYGDITFLAKRARERKNSTGTWFPSCRNNEGNQPALSLGACETCNVMAHGGSILTVPNGGDGVQGSNIQKVKWLYIKEETWGDITDPGGQFHPDIVQFFDGLSHLGGWIVFQDTTLRNIQSTHQIVNIGGWKKGVDAYGHPNNNCTDNVGSGGMLFHNVVVGNTNPNAYGIGAKSQHGSNNNHDLPAYWHIGVTTTNTAGWDIRDNIEKVIVVGGSGATDGWPGSLRSSRGHDRINAAECPAGGWGRVNPGECCPNGRVNPTGKDFNTESFAPGVTPIYCYDSIEAAVADGHAEPPFVRLSAVGWANPPASATGGANPGSGVDDTTGGGGGSPPPPPPPPPGNDDTDGDGLTDADEATYGTNPNLADTDSDGLGDGFEVGRGMNPLSSDTDGDGASDLAEIQAGTDPLVADNNGGGGGSTPPPPPPPANPVVTHLALKNADTDQSIHDPWLGESIDPSVTPRVAVVAVTSGGVESVTFALDGSVVRTENSPPYAMFDSGPNSYEPWTLPPAGSHTLAVTAHSANGGAGTASTPMIIDFQVIAPPPPPAAAPPLGQPGQPRVVPVQ
ncbi:MAG: hypothetical protein AAF430_21780 [Myxococcota bacterium]